MNKQTMSHLTYALSEFYKNAEDTKKIIIRAALVASTADAVASMIPGVALASTIIGCFGAVWIMYGHLCSTLGIKLSESTLKLLGKAVLSNIAANLSGLLLATIVGTFIPGVSVVSSAVITFVTVYIAGIIFLQLIYNMARKTKDTQSFNDISEEEMKNYVENAEISKDAVKEAKQAYKNAKNDPSYKDDNT